MVIGGQGISVWNPQSLRIAKRFVDFGYQEVGRELLTHHHVVMLDGIPWQIWQESAPPELQTFTARRAEFVQEIQERVEAEAEIDQCLKNLKAQPRLASFLGIAWPRRGVNTGKYMG